MTEQTEHSTLQRKAGTGRAPSDGAGMTAAKAFRLAVSKAAEVELGLAVRAQTIKEEHVTQAQILDMLDGEALMLMLEGPHDARGVAVLDIQAVSALIEVQTLGNVLATEAVARRPTRIDSAMCEALVDRVLKEFEGHLADTSAADWAMGFRFFKQTPSLRLLGLALVDVPYRLFHLPLDLADGAKHGMLQIVMPAQGMRQPDSAGDDSGWTQAMKHVVGDSHVGITGVLHRLQKTVSEVQAMAVGDLLNVPQSAITSVTMEGSDGCVVGHARLGQQNGFRALRVSGADTGLAMMIDQSMNLPEPGLPAPESSALDVPNTPPDMEMAMPAAMDALPEIGDATDAPALPAVDMEGVEPAPMGDLPDLPMMPMDAAPMEEVDDLEMAPMAAMPMDTEIA